MSVSSTTECLTKTQEAQRALQQRFTEKLSVYGSAIRSGTGSGSYDPGLATASGGTTAVPPSDKGQNSTAYGSPASQFLDISA